MSKIIYGTDEKIPGESAYDRCSYKGCKNGKYRLGGRKLFLFPSHTEPERREKWLQNCGNEELRKKADSSIRRSGICSDHFDSSCFTDSKKYSLKRNSIPFPNYPSDLIDKSTIKNNRLIVNKFFNESINTNVDNYTFNNLSTGVPKLFVDDDNLSDDDLIDGFTNYKDLDKMQENEDNSLSTDMIFSRNNKNSCESERLTDNSKLFLLDNSDEYNLTTNKSKLFSTTAANEKQIIDIGQKDCENINKSMTTIELLRKMNEEQNKEKKIEKLIKQNTLLRKELKTLKQNVRRWERRRQKKSIIIKKPTLKQQKRMVLNIINEMDISPVAKAIISLQLHTNKAPYSDDEKNLAKSFHQYSRNDIKRLKNVGCNIPSRSSIERWLPILDKSISTSTLSKQNSTENDIL